MSITSALLGTSPVAVRARGRGRPPVTADPEQRKRHEACASARILYGRSVADCMKAFDVSARTVLIWTKLALTYPGPIGDALRRASAARN